MLPKVQQSTLANTLRKDNLATQVISTSFNTQAAQDHLKGILAKSSNEHYKPWRNNFAPKNPHSPFGDFPPEYIPKDKIETKRIEPNYEISQSGLSLSKGHRNSDKYERQRGNGGMTSSTLPKRTPYEPPVPKCGAFQKR